MGWQIRPPEPPDRPNACVGRKLGYAIRREHTVVARPCKWSGNLASGGNNGREVGGSRQARPDVVQIPG
jgi:hypothetical protein